MKKSLSHPFILMLLLLLLPAAAAGATIRASLLPATFEAGESAVYRLTIDFDDRDGELSDLKLPQTAGVVISSQPSEQRQRSYSFNGQVSRQIVFGFALRAEKNGEYLLPPAELKAGSKVIKSNSVRFTVTPAAPETIPVPGKISPLPERKFYVGEVLPLQVTFQVPGMAIDAGKLSFSGGNALAVPVFSGDIRGDSSRTETIIRATQYLQLLAAGKGEFLLRLPIRYRDRRNRIKLREFTSQPVTVTILPRPAVPADLIDTGLTGKWNFALTLSKNPCDAGSSTTLIISASAPGNAALHANVKAPQITIPKCRVFPGKVLRRNGQIIFEYPVVPLESGRIVTTLPLACLDVDTGKYKLYQLPLFLLVTGTAPAAASPAAPPAAPVETPLPPPTAETRVNSASASVSAPTAPPPPEMSVDGTPVSVPLYRNALPWMIFSALVLLLLVAGKLFFLYRKRTSRRRRENAVLAALCRDLETGNGNILPAFEKHGVSAVAVAMGLPPGATAAEIAGKLADDQELQQIFSSVANTGYQAESDKSLQLSPELCQRLIKFLKSLMLWLLLCFLPLSLHAAETVSPRQLARTAAAWEKQHDLPRARLYWLRARLLAPGDREIAEKLAANGRALNLPVEDATFAAPFYQLRDMRRPDHYLAFAAILVMILGGVWVLREKVSRIWRYTVTAAAALLLVAALAAFFTQSAGNYSAKRLLLVAAQPKLCAAPVADADITGQPPAGSTAELLEKRGEWLHIRCADGSAGWISARQVQQVFPYGIW